MSVPRFRVPAASGPWEVWLGEGPQMGATRPYPVLAPPLFLIKFYQYKAMPTHLPVAPGWFSSHVAVGLVV